jgi:hypothetical protein
LNSAPLSVRLRPSPVLAILLIAGHLLGFLSLAVSLEGTALALAAAGVALSGFRTAGEALLRWADSPCEIELRGGGGAAWRDRHGRWHQTSVASGGYVSPWLIIVPLAGSGWRRKWIVVAPDAASRDDRRRLRAWLRWRHGKIAPDPE